MLSLDPLREGDLWWHLSLGESIVTMRALPATDRWTVAGNGVAFNAAHSWLSDVVLYVLATSGCLAALVTLQAILGAFTVALLQRFAYAAGAAAREAAMVTLVGFLAIYPFSTARPQIFSFALFASIEFVLLAAHSGRLRWLVALPALMALWVNLHGAWIMGLALIGLFELGWFGARLTGRNTTRSLVPCAVWGGASLLATFLNPKGIGIYKHLVVVGTSSISQGYVSEWQPPSLSQAFTWPFWGLLLIGGMLLVVRRLRCKDIPTMVALFFVVLALRYLRMIPFAVVALQPVLAKWLPRWRASLEPGKVFNSAVLGVMLLSVVLTTPYVRLAIGKPSVTLIDADFPVAACEVLAHYAHPNSGVFTLAEWGGYVGWRLGPDVRPFVDGRVELPPVAVWQDYLAITTGQSGWEERVRSWGLDYLLLSRERQERLASLAQAEGWRLLYEDDGAVLLAAPELETNGETGGYEAIAW